MKPLQDTHIRAYTEEDRENILHLLKLNTPKYFAAEEEADLQHYLAHEIELYYVVVSDGMIVGCGGINFAENKTIGKLSWDILHPDYQGKSFGSLLTKYRIEVLKKIESVQKITVRTSQLAYRFYEKQGFELADVVKNYWADGFDLYAMVYKETISA